MKKTAVILFNMGGPDSLDAVRPFLFNLFNDPAIIGAPTPIRWMLAKFISWKRESTAKEIYNTIGGKSPILDQTNRQASSLEKVLGENYKVFISMRYWHPFTDEAVENAKSWGADDVVLLPLYPQFSTTTNRSSLRKWFSVASDHRWHLPTKTICCYPDDPGFVRALADLIRPALDQAQKNATPRILFSAHGLPKNIVDKGDPYPAQVERTARAVMAEFGEIPPDWMVCYQSRVGPMEWIGPSIGEALEQAAKDQVAVVIVPVAFVSEHSETLVELDVEYRHQAEGLGISAYIRVPTVSDHPLFIEGLANLVKGSSDSCGQACQALQQRCPWKEEQR